MGKSRGWMLALVAGVALILAACLRWHDADPLVGAPTSDAWISLAAGALLAAVALVALRVPRYLHRLTGVGLAIAAAAAISAVDKLYVGTAGPGVWATLVVAAVAATALFIVRRSPAEITLAPMATQDATEVPAKAAENESSFPQSAS